MAKAIVAVSIMLVGVLVIAQGMSSIIILLASCAPFSYAANEAGRVPLSSAACSYISSVRQVAAPCLWACRAISAYVRITNCLN